MKSVIAFATAVAACRASYAVMSGMFRNGAVDGVVYGINISQGSV